MFLKGRIVFYLIICCNFLIAQNPAFNFQKLGSEEGLTNPNVFNIEQSNDGLVYVTTQNGIYSYDGYNFTKLPIDSLKSNALLNCNIGLKNNLYLALRNEGIAEYEIGSKRYSFAKNFRFNIKADNFIVTSEFIYAVVTGIKLTIVDIKSGNILEDKFANAESANRAHCIYKTKNNKIYVGRNNGLFDVTDATNPQLIYSTVNPVYSISEASDGSFYLGSSNKIIQLQNQKLVGEIVPKYPTKSKTFLFGGDKSITKLVVDKYNKIWFTSYPDENLYLYQNGKTYNVFDILGISETLIKTIYKDLNENIWVGTFNEGLYLIQNPSFLNFNFQFNGKQLVVNKILLKNKLVITATNNGLYGFNSGDGAISILSKPDDFFPEAISTVSQNSNTIYYLKSSPFDLNSRIFSNGKETYKFKPIVANQYCTYKNDQSIIADRNANILLCNKDPSKTLDTLVSFPDFRISVNAMLVKENQLYVATNNGLYIYSFETKKYNFQNTNELNFNITDLSLIDNQLYAAHENGITNISNKQLIQQLGNVKLNGVKRLKKYNNSIWLCTQDGLVICDEKLNPLQIINKSSGLLSSSVSDIDFFENEVCIATARGIAMLKLDLIVASLNKLKPIVITNITSGLVKLNFNNNLIQLNANQSEAIIAFSSPYFNKPSKQFYRYKKNNGAWLPLENTLLDLVGIEAGKTEIEIQTSINNVVWSDAKTFTITKEKKLSKTAIALILIIIGGLLVIAFISYLVLKKIKRTATKRLEEEQQMNLLKHQAMNALLSPHFIFNSLTSIQNYINTNNSLKASEYLAKFSRLIRMIIEKAAQREITLQDEITRLSYYLELEKERFKSKFDYDIIVDDRIDKIETKIPNMIIQPHVENCIIHGILPKLEHGSLKVNFAKSNSKLLITIEDDGIGLIKAKEHSKTGHKSLGTSTIKSILEINSKLSGKTQVVTMLDKSTLDATKTGTIITIELEH